MEPEPNEEKRVYTLDEKRKLLQRSLMLSADECRTLYPTERDVDKTLAERDKMLATDSKEEDSMGWDSAEPAPKRPALEKTVRDRTKRLRKIVEG